MKRVEDVGREVGDGIRTMDVLTAVGACEAGRCAVRVGADIEAGTYLVPIPLTQTRTAVSLTASLTTTALTAYAPTLSRAAAPTGPRQNLIVPKDLHSSCSSDHSNSRDSLFICGWCTDC